VERRTSPYRLKNYAFNDENHFITNNLCISFYQKQQEEDEQILSSLESHLCIT
jgi:hypothetical protein